MNMIKIILSIIAIPAGIFLFFYGGYDDSPGAQGLGLLIFVSGIVALGRNRKN